MSNKPKHSPRVNLRIFIVACGYGLGEVWRGLNKRVYRPEKTFSKGIETFSVVSSSISLFELFSDVFSDDVSAVLADVLPDIWPVKAETFLNFLATERP